MNKFVCICVISWIWSLILFLHTGFIQSIIFFMYQLIV